MSMNIKCQCDAVHESRDDENFTFSENMLEGLDLSTFEPKSRTKLRDEIAKFLISKTLVEFDLPVETKDPQCGT